MTSRSDFERAVTGESLGTTISRLTFPMSSMQVNGRKEFLELRAKGEAHQIEDVGRELRGMMAWVDTADDDYTEGTAAR